MTTTAHTEIEAKYDAGADVTLAALDEINAIDGVDGIEGVAAVEAPVEVELVASYYDTADLRLARAGITLRRRTGGSDEGWHLKLPETLNQRLELQRPLGRSKRVPRPLAELVTATARGGRLATVATVRTRRTVRRLMGVTGEPLAECADDRVEGLVPGSSPVAWREIEVELTGDGDQALLEGVGALLERAGAAPSAAPSKLARVLGERIGAMAECGPDGPSEGTAGALVTAHLRQHRDELVALDPLARRDAPGSVHKMRIAVRRLRSGLATYRRLLDRSLTDPLRDELKWLGAQLGPVRDAEVIRSRLTKLIDEQPGALVAGPVRRRLERTLGAEHREAHARLVEQLRSERYLALLEALDSVVSGRALDGKRATKPAAKVVPDEVGGEHRRWRRRLERAQALDAAGAAERLDEALHDVRKASKRVRYAAESACPVADKPARRLAGDMKQLQQLLGEHQDTVVTRAVLRRLATAAHEAGESTFTWGRLHALEQANAERAADRFAKAVDGGWQRPSLLH